MTTKARLPGCCTVPIEPADLPATRAARAVAAFKALGDATRFDIYRLIAAQDEPLCACDVVERFPLSQPTISHHLKILREAGLISVSRRGVWAYYAAEPDGASLIQEVIETVAPRPVRLIAAS